MHGPEAGSNVEKMAGVGFAVGLTVGDGFGELREATGASACGAAGGIARVSGGA